MEIETLSLDQLNKATLQRQLLLKRSSNSVTAAVSHLVGMQAQYAPAPFVGLWSRLSDFKKEDLLSAIHQKKIIKATMMRATLHLATAKDYLSYRTSLQPMLSNAWASIAKRKGADFDMEYLLKKARAFVEERPMTFAEISDMVSNLMPDCDVGAMRYAIRTHLPMVQIPMQSGWAYSGKPEFTLSDKWLGDTVSLADHFKELVFAYLSAFGPASITDLQTWSGMTKLRDRVEEFKHKLKVYRDENRRELLDIPDKELPSEDIIAPIRFLPEYDNILLSYNNRKRIIADEHRKKVFLPGLRVRATILVDGFVAAAWKMEGTKRLAKLVIEPFISIKAKQKKIILEEAAKLADFLKPEAKTYEVEIK